MEYPLKEEIGDPRFFVGRREELADLLDWVEQSKKMHSKSRAMLARRKKGKTALVQRLYNLLFERNDAQIVPFYIRIEETHQDILSFAQIYYTSFIAQYLAFTQRKPELLNKLVTLDLLKQHAKGDETISDDLHAFESLRESQPRQLWQAARQAPHRIAAARDLRIIQIIDEFQYMNRYLWYDEALTRHDNYCHSYMGTAESKVAPMIVTGSYIGWLTSIIGHMTSRFDAFTLEGLTDEEALESVYNYAALTQTPVTEETAAYIVEIAARDPFYISQMIRSKMDGLDLTTKEGVRAALQFETTLGKGFTANMWHEYIHDAFGRVNQLNSKKLVLYLARHGDEERSRLQIKEDLQLDLTDEELESRLYKLYMADLIARGSSYFHYKGLGDHVFEAVFRKIYGPEIELVDSNAVKDDFEATLIRYERRDNWYRGLGGEYKVMYHLLSTRDKLTSYLSKGA